MNTDGENARKYDEDEKGISVSPYGSDVSGNLERIKYSICRE